MHTLDSSIPKRQRRACMSQDPSRARPHLPDGGAAPEVARPSKAGDHLVRNHHHVVLVAHITHRMEVAGGRHHHTAGPLDRLSDEGGHALSPALASDGVVKLLRETLHEVGLALVWQALAVEGGARDVMGADGLQRQPHRRVHVRQARERAGRHRDAVVATIAREQLRLVRQPTRVVVRPQETDLRQARR
eukprot:6207835-Pleurochrysis_carterae.AAC.2